MKREKLSKAAASGAVALIFLVLGFQAAIFTGNVFRYNREHRVDTVYVVSPGLGSEKASLRARENIEPLFPAQSFFYAISLGQISAGCLKGFRAVSE